jgi:hypothetical protein
MFRIVRIPNEFIRYIELFVEKGYESEPRSVVEKIIVDGMVQMLEAVSVNAIDRVNLVFILDKLRSSDSFFMAISEHLPGYTKIEPLSRYFSISEDLTLSLIFFTGLYTQGYYFLRHEVPEYNTDIEYRSIVDNIPHDPEFESPENVPEIKRIIINDDDLSVHHLH